MTAKVLKLSYGLSMIPLLPSCNASATFQVGDLYFAVIPSS